MTMCWRRCVALGVFGVFILEPAVGHSQAPVTAVPAAGPAVGRAPAPPVAPRPRTTDYRIGAEDILEIVVWNNEALTRTVTVRPDGRISVPLLNDVQAADRTPLELREALTNGFAAYVAEPEVSVMVRETHSLKVSVVGLVKTAGRYSLGSEATILEALALAGGVTDFAKRDRIFVLRRLANSTIRVPFNYARVLDSWDEENFLLRSGDIVVVP